MPKIKCGRAPDGDNDSKNERDENIGEGVRVKEDDYDLGHNGKDGDKA